MDGGGGGGGIDREISVTIDGHKTIDKSKCKQELNTSLLRI